MAAIAECSCGARFPGIDDWLSLAEQAQTQGLILAPGAVFRPDLQASPWLRFNIAICDDDGVQRRLARLGLGAAPGRKAAPTPRR